MANIYSALRDLAKKHPLEYKVELEEMKMKDDFIFVLDIAPAKDIPQDCANKLLCHYYASYKALKGYADAIRPYNKPLAEAADVAAGEGLMPFFRVFHQIPCEATMPVCREGENKEMVYGHIVQALPNMKFEVEVYPPAQAVGAEPVKEQWHPSNIMYNWHGSYWLFDDFRKEIEKIREQMK